MYNLHRTTVLVIAAGSALLGLATTAGAQTNPGSKIVFLSTRHIVPQPPPGLDLNPQVQIYIMNADGTDPTRLTEFTGSKIAPVCSPDGRQVAFQSRPPGFPLPTIFLMNADGTDLRPLVSGGNFPSWSPNGKQIAFHTAGQPREISVIDIDTLELTNLTNNPADDFRADWSPDGQKIAFTSNRDGNIQIYVMNADGSKPTRLTSTAATDMAPDWSPDGRQIVFQSNRDHPQFPDIDQPGFEIYVMNADATEPTRLTDNLARDLDPAWSPNGRQIVFDSDRDVPLTRQLYVMSWDGTDQRALTGPPGENSHASWCRGRAVEP